MYAYLVTFKGVTKQVMANSEFDARVRGARELPHTVSDMLSWIKVQRVS